MSIVAIVGRPNVGKSTLFNKIVGRRKALVSDTPGVTRDRHYAEADWCGVSFCLVDTGGLSFDETDAVESKVHKQSMVAAREADCVICLFDGREGILPLDREIVEIFRRMGKRVVYAVNKLDNNSDDGLSYEFSEMGIDCIPISAEHKRNIDEILDRVIEFLPRREAPGKSEGMRIALVGRPNVGKSTIINYLANEERLVAHEKPGTTRDSIDVLIKFGGRDYVFVDTAGIKKKARTKEKLDKFSTLKSLKAVESADIVFVVLDAGEEFARQDIVLAAHSFDSYKATAVLINKWDLTSEGRGVLRPAARIESPRNEKEYIGLVRENLKELQELPILCISGKTGYNCNKIFEFASDLTDAKKRRIPTSELNRFFEDLKMHHPAPDFRGKQVKFNYITQVDIDPPVFVIFTSEPRGIAESYRKYLEKGLRRLLGGVAVPIVVKFRLK